jgi:2-polyprenyl-6-methoxyphenol hydroxylase-like FAD-dependent oxidoreductase/heme-degrading monooxygenase HmoA
MTTVEETTATRPRGAVRTLLRMRVREGCEERFEEAWRTAAAQIAGQPGNLRQELMRDSADPRSFLIAGDWADREAADAFGRSRAREALTAALRDLREDADRGTYDLLYGVAGGGQGSHVRIDISTRVAPGEEAAFERAYAIVTDRLRGTPGLIREELLRESGSDLYHIFAEWESDEDFRNWVDDPSHADQTGPIIRWLSVFFERKLYEIRFRPPEAGRQRVQAQPLAASPPPATAAAPSPMEVPEPRPDEVAPVPVNGSATRAARASEVLVVGAGPTGLTAAVELARRGIAVRVVERREQPQAQADKAIGIHCRTMEIWEDEGIVTDAMDAGIWLHGQTVFVNGRRTHQVDWAGLTELPYAHLGLPQYETERLLTAKLSTLGVPVEHGLQLEGFRQDDQGVSARLRHADGTTETTRALYLVGADGAGSTVREALGLTFEGGLSMFPQLFMLGDVDVDWGRADGDMPAGHLLRWVRIEDDGDFTGMLVCVPLKGRSRYRIATLAPERLLKTIGSGVVPPGFWKEYDPPTLADIQAAIDDLGPAGTTASNLRWSSIFRIKHGIVDRYRDRRVFVAGDAAHLHPPAGGQGMNTGIQDAWNLAWKLALAVRGQAAPGLLDSYEAERRPAGKAIVDRAVAIAFTDEMDMDDEREQFLLEMQMSMNYAGSPVVGEAGADRFTGGPAPGHRAPDVLGLRRFGVAHDVRLFDVTRGPHATLLLSAAPDGDPDEVLALEKLAVSARQASSGQVHPYLIADHGTSLPALVDLPVLRDAGAYRAAYGIAGSGSCAYLVRPDGHVGFRTRPADETALLGHLAAVFRA